MNATTQENRMTAHHENGDARTIGTRSPADTGQSTATVPSVALSSHDVLQGQKAVSISHNGALYRLQTTRQGKLILTK
jgi:hemin uptake protein HemP